MSHPTSLEEIQTIQNNLTHINADILCRFDDKLTLDQVQLFQKILKNASAQEVKDFIDNQEIPSVALSDSEMEELKGGFKFLLRLPKLVRAAYIFIVEELT